jgi:23S rRNA pseudouridine2605 synthase
MEKTGLLKVLVAAGLGSRRNLAEAIKQGRVMVNGQVATAFKLNIDPGSDVVAVDGRPVELHKSTKMYLILNKPAGVLSTTRDDRGRATIMDYLPPELKKDRLYPVGRLDKDSTGLILLTNDGELAYRLTHPRFEHPKEYHVSLNRSLERADREQLQNGIVLEDGKTGPALVKILSSAGPPGYSITIHEGRKHIVRRMFSHLGYTVLLLERVRLDNIKLGNLSRGQIRRLSEQEIGTMRHTAGL